MTCDFCHRREASFAVVLTGTGATKPACGPCTARRLNKGVFRSIIEIEAVFHLEENIERIAS